MAENTTGFQTSGYINKKGTSVEGGSNVLPPGYDIENQPNADIRDMPMKRVIQGSYPGDGGFPGDDSSVGNVNP